MMIDRACRPQLKVLLVIEDQKTSGATMVTSQPLVKGIVLSVSLRVLMTMCSIAVNQGLGVVDAGS
jgi:hypothetical protein